MPYLFVFRTIFFWFYLFGINIYWINDYNDMKYQDDDLLPKLILYIQVHIIESETPSNTFLNLKSQLP